jgi:hypothetical protein
MPTGNSNGEIFVSDGRTQIFFPVFFKTSFRFGPQQGSKHDVTPLFLKGGVLRVEGIGAELGLHGLVQATQTPHRIGQAINGMAQIRPGRSPPVEQLGEQRLIFALVFAGNDDRRGVDAILLCVRSFVLAATGD